MKITSIRMNLFTNAKFLAIATIIVDNAVALPGIRLYKREEDGSYFILMPVTRGRDEKLYETYHPVNSEARASILSAMVRQYELLREDDSLSGTVTPLIPDGETVNPEDLNVTEVRISRMNYERSPLRAFANVTIDNAIALKGIRIVEREDGLSVFMPTSPRRSSEDEEKPRYVENFHPISAEARKRIVDAVLSAYNEESDPAA